MQRMYRIVPCRNWWIELWLLLLLFWVVDNVIADCICFGWWLSLMSVSASAAFSFLFDRRAARCVFAKKVSLQWHCFSLFYVSLLTVIVRSECILRSTSSYTDLLLQTGIMYVRARREKCNEMARPNIRIFATNVWKCVFVGSIKMKKCGAWWCANG